jgi:hypothetical protein
MADRDPRVDPQPGDTVRFVGHDVSRSRRGSHAGERRFEYDVTVASITDDGEWPTLTTSKGTAWSLAFWREHCLKSSVAVPGSALDEVRRLTSVFTTDGVQWKVDAEPGPDDGYGGASGATVRRVYDVALGQDIPVTADVVEVVRKALKRTLGWGL